MMNLNSTPTIKDMKFTLSIIILILCCISCKKDDIQFFEGKDAMSIYIGQYEPDSTLYSFATRSAGLKQDTVFVKVRIQGPARKVERVIELEPFQGTSAAEGTDYLLPKFILPADSIEARYPVILLRSERLKSESVVLNVAVKASEHFEKGAIGQEIKKTFSIPYYKIIFNDFLTKPSYWDNIEWAVGTFSVVKLQFMFRVYGSNKDFENISTGELLNMRLRLRAAQAEYEAENGPLLDENGLHVTF
jgi:hypothetical protein